MGPTALIDTEALTMLRCKRLDAFVAAPELRRGLDHKGCLRMLDVKVAQLTQHEPLPRVFLEVLLEGIRGLDCIRAWHR